MYRPSPMPTRNAVAGTLLGIALGDALGLPYEGMSLKRVHRRFERGAGFRLFGRTGFVSDDTEQSALVAQALAVGGRDVALVRRSFRRSMVGWFARLPFGIGGATLRSCVRMLLGVERPGVRSAGNGAAMRAGVIGAHYAEDEAMRLEVGRALAALTHTDPRAIEAALYVAEVCAQAAVASANVEPAELVCRAAVVLEDPQLREAVDRALALADGRAPVEEVVAAVGHTGFVVHSVGLCTYCFARFGGEPMATIEAAILAGGDTDTHAAIVGGWVGALHGVGALPSDLLDRIENGPFGPTHLRGLATSLARGTPPPRWRWLHALLRNLALYPVVLTHGFARLVPRW